MYALDFEYDGQYLSDYGFIICDFNGSSGANSISAGSKITFNTVSRHRGKRNSLTSTQYNERIQAKFAICKDPETNTDMSITDDEYRNLMRWLNRNEFLKFQVLDDYDVNKESCFYNASFNVDKVKIREILYGLELTMETDSPFGYGEVQRFTYTINNQLDIVSLMDVSDEIGSIYPDMVITCNSDGDLTVCNESEDCTMTIRNCKLGEVITVYGDPMIITSSYEDHDICNDFNYEFFRIGNRLDDRINRISATLPCKVEISYSPIIKVSP